MFAVAAVRQVGRLDRQHLSSWSQLFMWAVSGGAALGNNQRPQDTWTRGTLGSIWVFKQKYMITHSENKCDLIKFSVFFMLFSQTNIFWPSLLEGLG